METRKEVETSIKQAAAVINEASAVLICAGAGIGVDPGLPDFRGNKGFWKAYPTFARLGLSFTDMANPGWFNRDPELAWGFYGHRLNLYRQTIPHSGFDILLEWGRSKPGSYFVFTSNVDGQFQKAGFCEEQILECHGSSHYLQCTDSECSSSIRSAEGVTVTVDETTMRAKKPLPQCPVCKSVSRPNILMFDDWNWLGDRTEAQQQLFNKWLHRLEERRVVIVECGAGTGIPTVRITSENVAARFNGALIRIDTEEPSVPPGQIGISMGVMAALEKINDALMR
jgi:NAD-dependent SIR2 family protein deacetylase